MQLKLKLFKTYLSTGSSVQADLRQGPWASCVSNWYLSTGSSVQADLRQGPWASCVSNWYFASVRWHIRAFRDAKLHLIWPEVVGSECGFNTGLKAAGLRLC